MKIIISDDIENEFRRNAMKRFGYGKGALSQAAEIALGEWSDREAGEISVPAEVRNDPVGAIEGLLKKHAKGATSVDLQHEARKIRVKRALAKNSH